MSICSLHEALRSGDNFRKFLNLKYIACIITWKKLLARRPHRKVLGCDNPKQGLVQITFFVLKSICSSCGDSGS